MDYSYIDGNLRRVQAELTEACRATGRDPEGVILSAAIKSADVGEINYLHRVLGVHTVGENRVQQLLERYDQLDRPFEAQMLRQELPSFVRIFGGSE